MKNDKSTLAQALAILLATLFAVAAAHASEKVIFPFGSNSALPNSPLASDSSGNLYGTANVGIEKCPVLYELSPASNGTWTETILYTFQNCFKTGIGPIGALSVDNAGNIYGSLYGFGPADGSGVVYELVKHADGTFTYKPLHNFGGDEGGPFGELAWDSSGNIYGATFHDSTTFQGEVFELSPQPNGSWKETILYSFPSPNGVGSPVGSVIFDGNGNLYGATFYGIGNYDGDSRGAIYELSPQHRGQWKFSILYNFKISDKTQFPNSRLIFDSSGNLYGTSQGSNYYGTIFEVSPSTSGSWTEKTIHTFTSGSDGGNTVGNLAFDTNGNLYGTTYNGGLGCSQFLCGTVYKLTPQSGGAWKESIFHAFQSATDGSIPYSGLLLGNDGNLYGTTNHGGSRYGYGTVYQITP
jgi:uncharacterized repeat protein (TIGR03803 family)